MLSDCFHAMKVSKPFDAICHLLKVIQSIYKHCKINLYIIDQVIQEKLLKTQPIRGRNFRKFMLNSEVVYSVFNDEEDFQRPTFYEFNEAKVKVINQQLLRIPLFLKDDTGCPEMCLEVNMNIN